MPEPSQEDVRIQIDLRLNRDDLAIDVRPLERGRRNAPSPADLSKLACRIYDARRERDKLLDRKLFGEPAWDMLLALYCLPARGEQLSVTALSQASGVAQTTALRWQAILLKEGLIERIDDEADARRAFVRLTSESRALLDDYLLRLHSQGL